MDSKLSRCRSGSGACAFGSSAIVSTGYFCAKPFVPLIVCSRLYGRGLVTSCWIRIVLPRAVRIKVVFMSPSR